VRVGRVKGGVVWCGWWLCGLIGTHWWGGEVFQKCGDGGRGGCEM